MQTISYAKIVSLCLYVVPRIAHQKKKKTYPLTASDDFVEAPSLKTDSMYISSAMICNEFLWLKNDQLIYGIISACQESGLWIIVPYD
jgi:hypothetical protein